jgi:cellulose synthase/poly-beta-1,6-N-acetylglucosamine synthase-like glycosyltransferase
MIEFFSLLILIYCIILLFYAFRFRAFESFELKKNSPISTFSIVIPFRNEAENLPQLLKSVRHLKYPSNMFEVILVNDHSEDDSKAICQQWKAENEGLAISIIDNQGLAKSPKKSAVVTALKLVDHDYVLTTDADCLLPEYWLLHYDQHLQNNTSELVAGPVKIIEDPSFWAKFQVLDMLSLQVVGLGSFKTSSPLFCNAANLCYKTSTIEELKAFEKHKNIISGDDVFNLEVYQQKGKQISALVHPDATVWTTAEPGFQLLLQQRIRWASKARHYQNKSLKALGLIVLLTNLILILSLLLAFTVEGFQHFWWLWLFKLGVDFYVLNVGNQFFKTNLCLRDYLIMLLIYPFAGSYFGLLSLRGNFSWKGRKYKV